MRRVTTLSLIGLLAMGFVLAPSKAQAQKKPKAPPEASKTSKSAASSGKSVEADINAARTKIVGELEAAQLGGSLPNENKELTEKEAALKEAKATEASAKKAAADAAKPYTAAQKSADDAERKATQARAEADKAQQRATELAQKAEEAQKRYTELALSTPANDPKIAAAETRAEEAKKKAEEAKTAYDDAAAAVDEAKRASEAAQSEATLAASTLAEAEKRAASAKKALDDLNSKGAGSQKSASTARASATDAESKASAAKERADAAAKELSEAKTSASNAQALATRSKNAAQDAQSAAAQKKLEAAEKERAKESAAAFAARAAKASEEAKKKVAEALKLVNELQKSASAPAKKEFAEAEKALEANKKNAAAAAAAADDAATAADNASAKAASANAEAESARKALSSAEKAAAAADEKLTRASASVEASTKDLQSANQELSTAQGNLKGAASKESSAKASAEKAAKLKEGAQKALDAQQKTANDLSQKEANAKAEADKAAVTLDEASRTVKRADEAYESAKREAQEKAEAAKSSPSKEATAAAKEADKAAKAVAKDADKAGSAKLAAEKATSAKEAALKAATAKTNEVSADLATRAKALKEAEEAERLALAELQRASQERATADQEAATAEADAKTCTAKLAAAKEELAAAKAESASRQKELAAASKALAAATANQGSTEKAALAARSKAEESKQRATASANALTEATQKLTELAFAPSKDNKLPDAEAKLKELTQSAEEASAEATTASQKAEAAKREASDAQQSYADSAAYAADLDKKAASAQAEYVALDKKAGELQKSASSLTASASDLEAKSSIASQRAEEAEASAQAYSSESAQKEYEKAKVEAEAARSPLETKRRAAEEKKLAVSSAQAELDRAKRAADDAQKQASSAKAEIESIKKSSQEDRKKLYAEAEKISSAALKLANDAKATADKAGNNADALESKASSASDAVSSVESAKASAEEALQKATASRESAQAELEAAKASSGTGASDDKAKRLAIIETIKQRVSKADELNLALAELEAKRYDKAISLATPHASGELALPACEILGLSYLAKNDPKAAIEWLTKPEVTASSHRDRALGLAYAAQGDYAAAEPLLSPLKLSGDAKVEVALAHINKNRGDEVGWLDHLDKAFSANRADPDVAFELGKAYSEKSIFTNAIPPLEACYAARPKDAEVLFLLGSAYANAGREAEAVKLLGLVARAERLSPPLYAQRDKPLFAIPHMGYLAVPAPGAKDEAGVFHLLGVAAANRGDLINARAALSKAHDKKPSDPLIAYHAGLASLEAGDLIDASVLLKQSSYPEALFAFGITRILSGDAEGAERSFADAVTDTSLSVTKKPWAQLGFGAALLAQKRGADAKPVLDSIKDKGVAPYVSQAYAVAAYNNSDYSAAKKLLGGSYGEKASIPEVAYLSGLIAENEKSPVEAERFYQHAVILAPTYLDGWLALGKTRSQQKKFNEAMSAYGQAVDLAPNSAEVLWFYIIACRDAGASDIADIAEARVKTIEKRDSKRPIEAKYVGRTVAVLPFEDQAKNPEYAWLQSGLVEAMSTDIARLGNVRVVERAQIGKALGEVKFAELGYVDAATAPKLGKTLGADVLILGSFTQVGEQIRLDARLVKVSDNAVLGGASTQGKVDDLFVMERQLAVDLVGPWLGLNEKDTNQIKTAEKPQVKDLQGASEARRLVWLGKNEEAKKAYQSLVDTDPIYARTAKDLADQWRDLSATVAVLPLKRNGGGDGDEWLSNGIAEALQGDLQRAKIRMVERAQITQLMNEIKFDELFNGNEGTAKAGKQLGASMVIIGSYQILADNLKIDVRLVQVDTGEAIAAESVTGKQAELFQLEGDLAQKLMDNLGADLTPAEYAQMLKEKPSIEDFKRTISGMSTTVVDPTKGATVTISKISYAPFRALNGSDDPTLPEAIAARLATAIGAAGKMKVLPSVADADDPRAAGRDRGADAVLVGSYQVIGGELRIDSRLLSIATGEVLATARATGTAKDIDGVSVKAAETMIASLGLDDKGPNKEKNRIWQKKWFWYAVGAGAVGAAAAGTAYGVAGCHSDFCIETSK